MVDFANGRKRCPFYGFDKSCYGILSDVKGGSQCALRKGDYVCDMVRDKVTPDWEECHLNTSETRKNLAENMKNIRIFPMEFCPNEDEVEEWEGIRLDEWMAHVEGRHALKH